MSSWLQSHRDPGQFRAKLRKQEEGGTVGPGTGDTLERETREHSTGRDS